MAICPIANSVGCEKCGVVKVCLLRSVVGNYGDDHKEVGGRVTSGTVTDEQTEGKSEQTDSPKAESKAPD